MKPRGGQQGGEASRTLRSSAPSGRPPRTERRRARRKRTRLLQPRRVRLPEDLGRAAAMSRSRSGGSGYVGSSSPRTSAYSAHVDGRIQRALALRGGHRVPGSRHSRLPAVFHGVVVGAFFVVEQVRCVCVCAGSGGRRRGTVCVCVCASPTCVCEDVVCVCVCVCVLAQRVSDGCVCVEERVRRRLLVDPGGNTPLRKCRRRLRALCRRAGQSRVAAAAATFGVVDCSCRPVARVQLQRARRMHTAARGCRSLLAPRLPRERCTLRHRQGARCASRPPVLVRGPLVALMKPEGASAHTHTHTHTHKRRAAGLPWEKHHGCAR